MHIMVHIITDFPIVTNINAFYVSLTRFSVISLILKPFSLYHIVSVGFLTYCNLALLGLRVSLSQPSKATPQLTTCLKCACGAHLF